MSKPQAMDAVFTISKFECGCSFDHMRHCWQTNCPAHHGRPLNCTCLNEGSDDGATTCWQHHDCTDGSCTHME